MIFLSINRNAPFKTSEIRATLIMDLPVKLSSSKHLLISNKYCLNIKNRIILTMYLINNIFSLFQKPDKSSQNGKGKLYGKNIF